MGLTESEREAFVAGLLRKSWMLNENTVTSPSGGLWFNETHFEDWTLTQFQEIFNARAHRIRKSQIGDWKQSELENKDVADVTSDIKKKATHNNKGRSESEA